MSKAIENKAAKTGWQEFVATDPPPSRDAINAKLTARQLPGISHRMYKHYHALVRHGYDNYVPINELDVAVKAERMRQAS